VGFVDHEEARTELRQQGAKRWGGEALGRYIQNSLEAGANCLQGFTLFGGVLRAVQQKGWDGQIAQLLHLVRHQGDERRDDDGQPAESYGGELVAEAFARACGHDTDHILTGQYVGDDFALVGTKVRQAEGAGQDLVGGGHVGKNPES
jgi:hypothetical protein